MTSVEIEAADVIKVILQFCKENDLQESFRTLQKECGVTLNTVESVDSFLDDIKQGKWDKVLLEVADLQIPVKKLEALHEQIVLEMVELREVETARALLRQSEALMALRSEDPERYLALEKVCNRTLIDPKLLYQGSSRHKRRDAIVKLFQTEVRSVPPSRLMVLLGQAMKWQRQEGLIPSNTSFDIFSGKVPTSVDDEDVFPSQQDITIKFGAKSYPECALFLPDGTGFVTGSADGFIEVWDVWTGSLKSDLSYQASEKFMTHESSVLSVAISHDGQLLASGSKDGEIKVWKLQNGQCLRKFEAAHMEGVTSLMFSNEKNKILSSSFDGTIRIHGIKSGKLLKEFRGHESFVHSAVFSPDEQSILSTSADSSVCLWNVSSSDCQVRFRPQASKLGKPVIEAFFLPSEPGHIIVAESSCHVYMMTVKGDLVRTYEVTGSDTGPVVGCRISNHGNYLIALTENGTLHCFEKETGKLINTAATGSNRAIGLELHPHKNILACYFQEGVLKLFKA
ncbi:hypothetical protein M9434_006444 [Picochlorum sp. BPE23]|nr:hypothetical protein M9434_006444 [Picochlorum sp. BPE23]